MATLYDFTVQKIDSTETTLHEFAGKALLIVNTASKCGFTPQLRELETVYQQYQERGFSVLAFPCNQFGAQEPGNNAEIAAFCDTSFKTTFPLFAKIEVNGKNAHPLFSYLKESAPGLLGSTAIKWNFTKFFIDREGHVIKRFAPQDKPTTIMAEMAAYL